jgi:methyl-accepting chemotaxis protein
MSERRSVHALRQKAQNVIQCILIAYVVALPIVALLVEPGRALYAGIALALCAGGAIIIARTAPARSSSRIALSAALISGPAVSLYIFAGHKWQLDMHMGFYAALAVTALLCDWRGILAASVATAVHHLGVNMIVPSLIFPGGTDYARVVLHAVIVLMQTGALLWLTKVLADALNLADDKVAETQEQMQQIERMSEEQIEAERARAAAEEEASRERLQAEKDRMETEARAERERMEAEEKARQERAAAEERERQRREEEAQRKMKEREQEAAAERKRLEKEARLMKEKAAAEEEARKEREAAVERRRQEEEQRQKEKLEAEERERKLREEAAEKERLLEKKRQEAEAEAMRQRAEEDKRRMREKAEAEERARKEREEAAERQRQQEIEAQRRMEEQRRTMIQKLGSSIGEVVRAAQAGDFSKTVEADFEDEELNDLAENLNSLVFTVKGGLEETITVLRALQESDLTKRVEGNYQGAFAALRDGVNFSADGLATVLLNLQKTSNQVGTSLSDLLSGVDELSAQTSTQAATLEETSASLQSFTTTVEQTAKRTSEMRDNARATQSKAEEGGQVMSEATEAMDRVAKSSKKVTEITSVIESIAFQTNLLALNASVEAARAGDAGKGFAVVASEVRNLAQSTANASKEIGQLISQSNDEIHGGVDLVSRAAENLRTIMEDVVASVMLIDEISQATDSQNLTLREINAAMTDLDRLTQGNNGLVDRNNQAISRAKSEFDELDRMVARFRLDGSARPGTAIDEAA